MSIMVTTTMPGDYAKMNAVVEAHPEFMEPYVAAATKYGLTDHGHLVRDGKVMELIEFATREDYENFQAELSGIFEVLDAEIGITAKEVEIWEFDPPHQA